ncbi:MAG: malonate decarboxylase holo-ACP synthase [Candidatus Velthaea sp.]
MTAPAVHDVLRIDPALARRWTEAPPWVQPALAAAPWVVVRRAPPSSRIAVGVRGTERTERFAATIAGRDVRALRSPYDAAAGLPSRSRPLDRAARLTRALAARCGLRCGFTGSYGFECATGHVSTHAASDLDVVIARGAPRAALAAFALGCAAVTAETGVRIDAEVLLAAGGAALAEIVASRGEVLVKTPAGPRLLQPAL